MQSKIFLGDPAPQENSMYMGSIQLSSVHICSSFVVRRNIFGTSAFCANYVEERLDVIPLSGSIVHGHNNRRQGQVYTIHKVKIHPSFNATEPRRVSAGFDVAIIIVSVFIINNSFFIKLISKN